MIELSCKAEVNDREKKRLHGCAKLMTEDSWTKYHCLERHRLSQLQGADPISSLRTIKMLCQHLH